MRLSGCYNDVYAALLLTVAFMHRVQRSGICYSILPPRDRARVRFVRSPFLSIPKVLAKLKLFS